MEEKNFLKKEALN